MDDFGRPVDVTDDDRDDHDQFNARDDDGVRYNVGVISEWYDRHTDFNSFMTLVKPGDLLEFQREAYCHWAVYIGDYALADDDTADDENKEYRIVPCVVHRANPADSENIQSMLSTSRSLSKGLHGIGAVVVEPLTEVWDKSRVRVNNGLDNSLQPYSSSTVVQRALSVANGENSLSYTAYNVISNNCEHFASWCRCGWNISCQVARRSEQVLKLAMMAGAALLPRPVSVLGGLCVAGLHMMGQLRRTTEDVASNIHDQFTDSAMDRFTDITDTNNTSSSSSTSHNQRQRYLMNHKNM